MKWIRLAAVLVALGFVIYMALFGYAHSHSWYDAECCNEKDCAPVPDPHNIIENADGTISYKHCRYSQYTIRNSQDGDWHACIGQYTPPGAAGGHCYCIYRPRPMF